MAASSQTQTSLIIASIEVSVIPSRIYLDMPESSEWNPIDKKLYFICKFVQEPRIVIWER